MKRFNALDELRGIAILAMIFAHWGPGLYQRLDVTGFPLDLLHFFGRIATPAFILVFGITIGIAFIPSIRSGNTSVSTSLLRRSKIVFVAMLIISLPKVIEIAYDNSLEASYLSLLLATYSVLTFYTLAIAITALLLSKISEIGFAILGTIFILTGTLIDGSVWPPSEEIDLVEITRLVLFSGKYGFFVLLGCAYLLVPVSVFISKSLKEEQFNTNRIIVLSSLFFLLIGTACAYGEHLRDFHDLAYNYFAPPVYWYFFIVSGLVLFVLYLLHNIADSFFKSILRAVGKNPLKIYVSHKLVIPLAGFLSSDLVHLNKTFSILLVVLMFFMYILYCIKDEFSYS